MGSQQERFKIELMPELKGAQLKDFFKWPKSQLDGAKAICRRAGLPVDVKSEDAFYATLADALRNPLHLAQYHHEVAKYASERNHRERRAKQLVNYNIAAHLAENYLPGLVAKGEVSPRGRQDYYTWSLAAFKHLSEHCSDPMLRAFAHYAKVVAEAPHTAPRNRGNPDPEPAAAEEETAAASEELPPTPGIYPAFEAAVAAVRSAGTDALDRAEAALKLLQNMNLGALQQAPDAVCFAAYRLFHALAEIVQQDRSELAEWNRALESAAALAGETALAGTGYGEVIAAVRSCPLSRGDLTRGIHSVQQVMNTAADLITANRAAADALGALKSAVDAGRFAEVEVQNKAAAQAHQVRTALVARLAEDLNALRGLVANEGTSEQTARSESVSKQQVDEQPIADNAPRPPIPEGTTPKAAEEADGIDIAPAEVDTVAAAADERAEEEPTVEEAPAAVTAGVTALETMAAGKAANEEEEQSPASDLVPVRPADVQPAIVKALHEKCLPQAYWLAYAAYSREDEPNLLTYLGLLLHAYANEPGRAMPNAVLLGLRTLAAARANGVKVLRAPYERLLLAGALVPSLAFSPNKAPEVIWEFFQDVRGQSGCEALDRLMERTWDFAVAHSGTLRAEDVSTERSANDPYAMEEICARAAEFGERIDKARVNYVPAQQVLRRHFRSDGALGRMLDIVRRNDIAAARNVRQILDGIDISELLNEVQALSTQPFLGPNRDRFLRRVSDAMDIGQEWLEALQPSGGGGNEADAEEYRHSVGQFGPRAVAELQALAQRDPGSLLGGAAAAVADALQRFMAQALKGAAVEPLGLEWFLLDVPGVRLGDGNETRPEQSAKGLAHLTTVPLVHDAAAAFEEALDHLEFNRARQLLLLDRRETLSRAKEAELRQRLVAEVAALRARCKDLELQVEDAYLLGELSGHSGGGAGVNGRTRLTGVLADVLSQLKQLEQPSLEEDLSLQEAAASVESVAREIHTIAEQRRALLRAEHDALCQQFSDAEDRNYFSERFGQCLVENDTVAAAELMHHAREAIGERRPMARVDHRQCVLLREFAAHADGLSERLHAKAGVTELVEAARTRRSPHGLRFGELDAASLDTAAAALETMQELRSRKGAEGLEGALRTLLTAVGFDVSSVGVQPTHASGSFTEATVSLASRPNCPVPAFGSELHGRLPVVVLHKPYNDSEFQTLLQQQLRLSSSSPQVLLVHPQPINLQKRLQLRSIAARGAGAFSPLLLDMTLLAFVVAQRNRLDTFFRAALPFTFTQPYLKGGGNVPIETFKGRRVEVNDVLEKDGACIVYGGRQLGKSALLRHVTNEYHRPEQGAFVIYRDVDEFGGRAVTHLDVQDRLKQTADEIRLQFWKQIAEDLGAGPTPFCKVDLSDRRRGDDAVQAVQSAIRNTLRANPHWRVLLLLDETDRLIRADAQMHFQLIKSVRELMEQTQRRFKVVFAGLSSVQKYKRIANNPFAQLGREIVIDPLPPEAGAELVVEPLRALGFEFERPRLVLRILSQANYHPGLVQIFCHQLVTNLTAAQAGNRGNKNQQLPQLIREQDIRAVEMNASFTNDVRARFFYTMDLDDRYKLLVYALILSNDAVGERSEKAFRELGESYWPQQFEALDSESMRGLLEEMTALGLLVKAEDDSGSRWRLRSPNLLRLLGNRDEIEEAMTRLIVQEKPREANPLNFHPMIHRQPAQFGPLSMRQSGDGFFFSDSLMGIRIITGSQALGIDQVAPQITHILSQEAEDWQIEVLPPQTATNRTKLLQFLSKDVGATSRRNLLRVVSLDELPVDVDVLDLVQTLHHETFRKAKSRSKARFVLLMGPQTLWRWLYSTGLRHGTLPLSVRASGLEVWSDGAIQRALEDAGMIGHAKDASEDLFERTSGFHILVEDVLRAGQSSREQDARRTLEQVDGLVADRLKGGGLAGLGLGGLPESLVRVFVSAVNLGDKHQTSKARVVIERAHLELAADELGVSLAEALRPLLKPDTTLSPGEDLSLVLQWLLATRLVLPSRRQHAYDVMPPVQQALQLLGQG